MRCILIKGGTKIKVNDIVHNNLNEIEKTLQDIDNLDTWMNTNEQLNNMYRLKPLKKMMKCK